ncbi:phragmoplastin interacting protein 1 [Humulus lupulus]|uniref:phragmoplastin interacting protein 1 n=1 Tax=Humulus lupulus TaxID=3486 RepID=UPI002B417A17|nr:phragmoplastin interacting protein 1 [Humulus lupulus]
MVLSNKKLKQQLRAELAESLAASLAKPDSNNDGSANPNRGNHLQPQPQPLKVLLDSATQRTRLSKREKRRKTLSLLGPMAVNCDGSEENKRGGGGGGEEEIKESGSEGLGDKKKKRKREINADEKDGILGSEENGVDKSNEKKSNNKKKKKNKKKNKNKANANAKEEEEKETENVKMVMETNMMNDSQTNGNVTTKVYVGGIPYYSTEDDIRSYFEGCGTITEIDCMTFPESGKFRGIAIISFKTEAASKRALALDGADMGGLFLTIQPYKTNRTNKSSNFPPQFVEGYNRIYVGNLSWDITEDKLRNFFSDCKISSVRFGVDKETGEFRGYAHVDFVDNLSLALALKLDQKHVCGRPVKISCAVPLKKAAGTEYSRPVPTTTETTNSRTVSIAAETTGSRTVLKTTETTESNTGVPTVSTGKMKRRTCYECGEKGHISSDCPKKQAADSTKATTD